MLTPPAYAIDDPRFWSPENLEGELRRVFQICNGCRLCYNLCPSFPALLNRIDALDPERADTEGKLLTDEPMAEHDAARALAGVKVGTENPVDRLGAADFGRVVDLCYNCKLCFPICPYVPPHEFAVDFPRLMLRAKAVRAREDGVSMQDRFLGATDLLGSAMTKLPVLANWANHNSFNRLLMEKTVGIHRERNLPNWAGETFDDWWRTRREAQGLGKEVPSTPISSPTATGTPTSIPEQGPKALLFYTCFANYNDPDVAQAAVEVLERNGVTVAAPPMRCCGMPSLDGGDIEGALAKARANVESLLPYVRADYAIVSPGPTCTFMLRQEYPELLGTAEARTVAKAVRDLCEYLIELKKAGKLDRSLARAKPLKVAYHFSCHLKVQKLGLRSRDLLALIPGVEVEIVDRCCGMDGTWGMKQEYYQLSLKVADKATLQIEELAQEAKGTGPDHPEVELAVVSDCPLAALQLEKTTGRKAVHPILLLRDAYRAAEAEGQRTKKE